MIKEKVLENIKQVKNICSAIDSGENYYDKMVNYFPEMKQMISKILENNLINEQFVLQVLNDIVYGMEKQDEVILRDTLRYGLQELYQYFYEICQKEEKYE